MAKPSPARPRGLCVARHGEASPLSGNGGATHLREGNLRPARLSMLSNIPVGELALQPHTYN
jgi:hypothetical protein